MERTRTSIEVAKKFATIGGKVDAERIVVNDITMNNSYSGFSSVVLETFFSRNYEFHSSAEQLVVLDIGANAGASALFLAKNPKVKKIYAYEPVPPIYEKLQANLQLNPKLASKIVTFAIGLGGADTEVKVRYCEDQAMSASTEGLFDRYYPDSTEITAVVKDVRPVFTEILETNPDSTLFLKLDCEGAEFAIIAALAEANLLHHVTVAVIEFHGENPDQLLNAFNEAGFVTFVEWHRHDISIGFLKAARIQCRNSPAA